MGPIRLDRSVLAVSGPDARTFLNNLITQDLARLDATPCLYGALLTPQGKVETDFFLWAAPDGAVRIDVARERAEALSAKLSLFRLRAAVTIVEEGADWRVYAGTGIAPAENLSDPRRPELGWRWLTQETLEASADTTPYGAHLIAHGVPDLLHDAEPAEVFALEALLEELDGVAFHKGCFVGQENVSRMKRRATTRRKFAPLVFDGAPPTPLTPVTAGGVEIGSVRSGAPGRALALLRLDRAREAAANGVSLDAGGRPVRLDPPAWLIAPD